MIKRKNIGELLIEYGKISMEDLEEGLRLQKEFGLRLGATLIKLGKVTMDDIEWVLSKQLDIPYVIVENINLDRNLIYRFSEEFLMKNRILPLYETEDEIAVATDDPLNKDAFESVERISGKKVKLSSGNGEKIEETLTRIFKKEGAPALTHFILDMLEKIRETPFYRIDFILSRYKCEICIFGFGVLKKMAMLSGSYEKERIYETLDSLELRFLYDEYSNQDDVFISVYPLINRNENIRFPAILGIFGLYAPDDIAFADIHSRGMPPIFVSDAPKRGYPFFVIKDSVNAYDETIFTVDSAPEEFKDCYVNVVVPRECGACGGEGCEKCRNLGYEIAVRIEGIYNSQEFRQLVKEAITWPR